jgi:hypothetical protein
MGGSDKKLTVRTAQMTDLRTAAQAASETFMAWSCFLSAASAAASQQLVPL